MSSDKLKIIKCLLWILLALVIVIIAGYFLYSCSRLNNAGVSREYFSDKRFITRDYTVRLQFNGDVSSVSVLKDDIVKDYTVIYRDNIFEFKSGGETEYEFIVLDERTLYGSTGDYYYLYGERT